MQLIGKLFTKIITMLQMKLNYGHFKSGLNLRSIVTNVQLYVLDFASDNLYTFCGEEPKI